MSKDKQNKKRVAYSIAVKMTDRYCYKISEMINDAVNPVDEYGEYSSFCLYDRLHDLRFYMDDDFGDILGELTDGRYNWSRDMSHRKIMENFEEILTIVKYDEDELIRYLCDNLKRVKDSVQKQATSILKDYEELGGLLPDCLSDNTLAMAFVFEELGEEEIIKGKKLSKRMLKKLRSLGDYINDEFKKLVESETWDREKFQ